MTIEKQLDGSLVIEESFRFLRAASQLCLASAIAVAIALASLAPDALSQTKGLGWAALVIPLFCGIGLVVDDRRFVFDTSRQAVTWHRRNVFRVRSGEIPFADIRDVAVTKERSREDGAPVGGYIIRHGVALITSSGRVPLSATFNRDAREYEQVAEKVLEALAAPRDTAGPTVERLVAAGQIIDAIALVRRERGLDLAAAQAAVSDLRGRHPGRPMSRRDA